jgi:hypothetical protein
MPKRYKMSNGTKVKLKKKKTLYQGLRRMILIQIKPSKTRSSRYTGLVRSEQILPPGQVGIYSRLSALDSVYIQ